MLYLISFYRTLRSPFYTKYSHLQYWRGSRSQPVKDEKDIRIYHDKYHYQNPMPEVKQVIQFFQDIFLLI